MTTKVIVYHRGYGCATGCCGHAIRLEEIDENSIIIHREEGFEFGHAYGDLRKYAEGLVRDEYGQAHVANLDWERCVVVDEDCEFLTIGV